MLRSGQCNAQKKLRQITELQELKQGGGKLNSEQKAKVKTLPALKMELDELLEDVAAAEAEVAAVQARQQEERRQEERRREEEAKKRGAGSSRKDKKQTSPRGGGGGGGGGVRRGPRRPQRHRK